MAGPAAVQAPFTRTVDDMGVPLDLGARIFVVSSFPGSAWERTAWQALPAEWIRREAEPRIQCVPRQSLGTRTKREPTAYFERHTRPSAGPSYQTSLAYLRSLAQFAGAHSSFSRASPEW